MKIEPGFFQVFLKPGKNPVKTRKKPGKNPVKTWKKPAGKCGEYAESWGSGDVVTDRGRTTHVPARGKTPGKNPVQFFTDPLLTDPFWPEPIFFLHVKFLHCQKWARVQVFIRLSGGAWPAGLAGMVRVGCVAGL